MKNINLRTKILLSVGLIILVVLATSTFVQIHHSRQQYLQALEWRSEALAQNISTKILSDYATVSQLYSGDAIDITGILLSSSSQCETLYERNKDKGVAHVAIIDASHMIIGHNARDQRQQPVESAVLLTHLQNLVLKTVLVKTAYHTLVPVFADQDVYLGTIDIGIPKQTVDENTRQLLVRSGGLCALFLVLMFITISILIHRVVITPIRRLVTVSQKVARGDLTHTTLPGQEVVTTTSGKQKNRNEISMLLTVFYEMITHLNDVVVQVKSAADHIALGSGAMRTTSEQMSQGAAEQAAASEEASASVQEMTANIRQNADNALQTERIAVQSAEYAKECGRVVAETVEAIQQIAKKISIIQQIAEQTRMLSLNATIEAARAQEHGKAFSVVASEVRKLSDITKTAAEEINELASSGVDVAENAGTMLTQLVPNIHKTAELVQEISAASTEERTGAEHINQAIQQLDRVAQQHASTSETVTKTAEELARQAEQLRNTIKFFKVEKIASKTGDVRQMMRPL